MMPRYTVAIQASYLAPRVQRVDPILTITNNTDRIASLPVFALNISGVPEPHLVNDSAADTMVLVGTGENLYGQVVNPGTPEAEASTTSDVRSAPMHQT
jgi:hypothetical protein